MNLVYYYITFIVICFLCIICLKYKSYTNVCVFLISIYLISFQIIKNPLVDDGASYLVLFDQMKNFSDFMLLGKEPVFSIFPVLLKSFDLYNRYTIFGLFAVIGVSLKMKSFVKYSALPLLSIVLYFPYYYLKLDNSGIRSGCAIAIYLWAIQDIYNKNIFKYLVKLFFASLFHSSILIALPFYFFMENNVNYKKYFLVFIIILFLDIINYNPIKYLLPNLNQLDRLTTYTSGEESGGDLFNPLSKTYLLWVLEAIFLFKNYTLLINYNKYALLIVKIFYVGILLLYLVAPVSTTMGVRLSEIFLFLNCIVISYFFYFIRSDIYKIVFILFLVSYAYYTLSVSLSYEWLVDRHYF